MHPARMNLYRRIAILEASVVSQEKRCMLIGWKRPENGAYDKVVKHWPCTRDKSKLKGNACCHCLGGHPKPANSGHLKTGQ